MALDPKNYIPALMYGATVTTPEISASAITGAKQAAGKDYGMVCTVTNGTTPVNVFGAGGAPVALTVTGIFVVARDTTAGNITVQQAGNTVATIAKGVTAGVATGGAVLSNTVYAAADVCTVLSSTAGNADVFITYTIA